jgi:acetoacetate decarboxylase
MAEKQNEQGRMTPERDGFSGPAASPLYEIPMQVKRANHLLFRYETNREAVLDILPSGLTLPPGPAIVQALVQFTDSNDCMPYIGTYVFPMCEFEGKPYAFEHFLMVTNDAAMASGREFWGDSKKICHSELVFDSNEIFTTCERPRGMPLVATHFRTSTQISAEELPDIPAGLCLKMIPSAEEGKPLEVHQYVEDNANVVPITDASGRHEIYRGTGSVMMPYETDVWPIYRLKPIRMLDSYLIRGDMDFGYGKILKDFNGYDVKQSVKQ